LLVTPSTVEREPH